MLYFCGIDFSNVLCTKGVSNINTVKLPTAVDPKITNVYMGLNFLVYQTTELSWFVKGESIDNVEIFPADLEISQVCVGSNVVVGLSKANVLYVSRFESDLKKIWMQDKEIVKAPANLRVCQIVANEKAVYATDSQSVFEVSDTLELKWRLDGIKICKLACGYSHFIVLTDTGALYSWGSGGRGELGHFENDNVMVNCNVPRRLEFFDDLPCIIKDVCCGGWHTLALTSDGDIYSWGWNESGQLGHDKLSRIGGLPYPVDLGSANDPVVQISCGSRHSIASLKSGILYSWGLNKHGQLGVGDTENKSEPTKICQSSFQGNFVKLEGGRWFTFLYFD